MPAGRPFVLVLGLVMPLGLGAAPPTQPSQQASQQAIAVVRRHAEELETHAKRLQLTDKPGSRTLSRAAQALRTSLAADPDTPSTALVPRAPKSAKVQAIPLSEFLAKHAAAFPPAQNGARGGTVRASSSHAEMEDAVTVLGGSRRRDVWAFNADRGQLEFAWTKPVETRYVLLFNRPADFGDHWLETTVTVNGRDVAKLDRFETGHVLILDLGGVYPVRTLKMNVTGVARPGLSGVELHRRQLATPPLEAAGKRAG